MRRLLTGLVLGVVVLPMAAVDVGAGPRKVWKQVAAYDRPAAAASVSTPLGTSTGAGYCLPDATPPANGGCVRFELPARSTSFELEIEDLTGLPVLGLVVNPADGTVVTHFCGASDRISAVAYEIHVWLVAGTCPGGTAASLPTMGTVTASFYR